MNNITVKYYSIFCMAAKFCREEQVEPDKITDLWALIDFLTAKYGEDFQKKLFDRDHSLLLSAWVLVNGERLNTAQFGQCLKAGDTVIFTSPLLVGG